MRPQHNAAENQMQKAVNKAITGASMRPQHNAAENGHEGLYETANNKLQ